MLFEVVGSGETGKAGVWREVSRAARALKRASPSEPHNPARRDFLRTSNLARPGARRDLQRLAPTRLPEFPLRLPTRGAS